MARGITETDVWQAADALLLGGDRPTIERIRQQLGRGSPNTVSPHLDTWFRGLGARIQDPQAFAAPAAVPDTIQQAAAHFWQVALATGRNQVDMELAAERHELAETRIQLEGARLALTQEEDRQAARREGMEAAMRAIEAQLQAANDRVASLEQRLTDSAREIEALRAQSISLANDNEAWRTRLEGERATHEATRVKLEERTVAHEQRWSLEVDRARELAKQAQVQFARSEKLQAEHLSTWSAARDRLEADLATMTERAAKRQVEMEQAKAALSLAEKDRKASRTAAAQRETALLSQTERLQDQLSGALEQLRVKDTEQSTLLRSLLENANGGGKRPAVRRG